MTKIKVKQYGRSQRIRTYKSNLNGLSGYERKCLSYEAY